MDISKIDPKIFKRRRKILPLVSTKATAGLWWWLNSPRDLELQLYCIFKCFCIYICICICRCMCICLCVCVIAWVIWLVVTQGLPESQREPVQCSCQSWSSQADSADRFTHLLASNMAVVDPVFQELLDKEGEEKRGLWRVQNLELVPVPEGWVLLQGLLLYKSISHTSRE